MTELTQAIVREFLDYNPETGALTWRQRSRDWFPSDKPWKLWNAAHAGKPAFAYRHDRGRLQGAIFNKLYYAHRVIWLWMTGAWPTNEIDHKNRNAADNRWANLRAVTHAENHRNVSLRKTNTSGFTGVYKIKNGYCAKIEVNYRPIHLGHFRTLEEAVAARFTAQDRLGFATAHGTIPRRRLPSPQGVNGP